MSTSSKTTRSPDPARILSGTPEEIAAGLLAYRDAGVDHVICGALATTTHDYTSQVIALTANALAIYQSKARVRFDNAGSTWSRAQ